MSRHQHPPKRHQRAAGQAPSTPLAWLLRDPHSTEELRRTIDAWSRFIERHLQDEDADVRAFAQMAIVRRAAAHAILKEHEAALADVALAMSQIPGDALVQCKALEVKAMIQADQEDHACSLATFAELWPLLSAAALPPEEQAELWLARGKCYGRLKRYEEAISDFTQAHTLDPCCGEALCWRAMARVLGQEEDFRPSEEALADADQAVVLEPHNATCRRVQGVLLRMAMRFPESLLALRLAEQLDPADPWIKQSTQMTLAKWLWCHGVDGLEERERTLAEEVSTDAPAPPPEPAKPLAKPPPASRGTKTRARQPRHSNIPPAPARQGLFF